MINRRSFIKYTLAVGAGMFLTAKIDPTRVFASTEQAAHAGRRSVRKAARRLAALPGGTLDPTSVAKYVTPLVIPPPMPQAKRPKNKGPRNYDYYEIAVQEFSQFILPDRPTTVWSYAAAADPSTQNYPAFTIEAKWKQPVRIKWINGLVDSNGNPLPHLLPIDQTLHWANPPGGLTARDSRGTDPAPYTGPVPMVTHVHGAHTTDESDGYAEAWFLPNLAPEKIPTGYATAGSWYNTFKAEFLAEKGEEWAPGTATYQYPNDQRAATLWYHDHTLGMTRSNVYAGPAGFYLIRGGPDDLPAGLPGPAPSLNDPAGTNYYEIPIAIQDRSFDEDGSLFYPDNRAFFEGLDPGQLQIPFIPAEACAGQSSDVSPIWNPEFFGNTIVVNGKTWPVLNVEPRRYRFRLLNGCNSRFVILKIVTGDPTIRPGVAALPLWQIGAEGGFLPAPVQLNEVLMSPAERADVIVDFTGLPVGAEVFLINEGPDEPFGGGAPGVDFPFADPATTGQVMKFVVGPLLSVDKSTPPSQLRLPARAPLGNAIVTRQVSLNEEESRTVFVTTDLDGNVVLDCASETPFGPTEAKLGTVMIGGNGSIMGMPMMWDDAITENPATGNTEVWEIYNFTMDAHPIHVHEVMFEVVDRQPFDMVAGTLGQARGPEVWETGVKDTVIAYPGEITRIKAKFDLPGLYVWHCHIVEHEDNEMMRPYAIGGMPVQIP